MSDTIPRARGALPLFGHAVPLARGPLDFLESQRALGPIVQIGLGPRPAYVLNDPELVQQVLVRDADSFDKGKLFEKLRSWLGNGLFNSEGAFHRTQRRRMQPAFHHQQIARYCQIMTEQAEQLAAAWRDRQDIDLDTELQELTLRIVAKSLFRAEVAQHASREIGRSLSILLPMVAGRSLSPVSALEKLPTPANRRFDEAVTRIRANIEEIVRTYRREDLHEPDLLTMLITASGVDADRQIIDEVISVMSAGTETSASTLCWVFHELGRHPDVERTLHQELDAVLAAGPVSSGDVEKLVYTQAVLSETLRMDCPIWITMRRSTAPVELGDVHLPAGTQFIISPRTLHRDPTLFADPLRFDPRRWLPPRDAATPRHAYLPFGAGRRKCIGDSFAWYEMIIAVATVSRRWRLEIGPRLGRPTRVSAVARPDARRVTVHDRARGVP